MPSSPSEPSMACIPVSRSTSHAALAPPQVAKAPSASDFDSPGLDRHSPTEIANTYHRFETRLHDLLEALAVFEKSCTRLRWSYSLSLATHSLSTTLSTFLSAFYVNAVRFPLLLEGDPKHPVYLNSDELRGLPPVPALFRDGAVAFGLFRRRLNEFREYSDEVETLNTSIEDFEKELEASCSSLISRSRIGAVVDYAVSMGSDSTYKTRVGMPSIQSEQTKDTQNVLEISGVATFFSAVTATMLQISFASKQSPTMSVVNTMWFCSLVLSIGAALNNLLATAWKRSILYVLYRLLTPSGVHPPDHNYTHSGLPARMIENWVAVWLRSSPSVLLALSIWFFTVGLVLFIFASNQPSYTSILTLCTIAVASLGLLSALASMAHKVWIGPFLATAFHQLPRTDKSGSGPPKFLFRGPTVHHDDDHHPDESTSDLSDSSSLFPKVSPSMLQLSFSFLRRLSLSRGAAGPGPTSITADSAVEKRPVVDVAQPEEVQHRPEPRLAWKRSAKAAAAMSAFQQGAVVSRQPTYPLDAIIELDDVPRGHGHFQQPHKSPFLLRFLDVPRRAVPLKYGTVQDLEYSPNGRFLATTQ
ncbi:hypothetical protein H0H87_012382 [Tephrocybe sp. NHM501043]|nr:hypothetical protein H0H87_012382 [Tephrocybe sp. NHM501043]